MPYTVITPEMIAAASSIAGIVEIKSIRLLETEARNSTQDGLLPTVAILESASRAIRESSEPFFNIEVMFEFSAIKEINLSAPPPDPLVYVRAHYETTYKLGGDGNVSLIDISAFGQINGIFNSWPYWREYVQSTLGRMGLPAYSIPVTPVETIAPMTSGNESQITAESTSTGRKRSTKTKTPHRKN